MGFGPQPRKPDNQTALRQTWPHRLPSFRVGKVCVSEFLCPASVTSKVLVEF